jgi:hypothetical protein
MATVTQHPQLMDLLEFTPEDLALNREGKLSEMQRYRLQLRRRRTTFIGAGILIASVLLASGLIFAGNRSESPVLSLIGIGITICTAALMGSTARFWLRLNSDINSDRLIVNSGKLQRVIKPVNRSIQYYAIRVEAAEVMISKEAFDCFDHGADYTLYRTPYTGTLLSVEKR